MLHVRIHRWESFADAIICPAQQGLTNNIDVVVAVVVAVVVVIVSSGMAVLTKQICRRS